MDDNLNLDQIENNVEEKLKVKNRFEQLSEKVIVASKERDDANAKVQTESTARVQAEKERDFFKSFSQISSKHPEAANYQDQILERVNKGYDPEEAALAVLAKEGKLGQTIHQSTMQVEGGSAPTTMSGAKPLDDMKASEKLDALKELDREGKLYGAIRGLR